MSLLLLFVVSFSPLTHKFLKWQSVVIAVAHGCVLYMLYYCMYTRYRLYMCIYMLGMFSIWIVRCVTHCYLPVYSDSNTSHCCCCCCFFSVLFLLICTSIWQFVCEYIYMHILHAGIEFTPAQTENINTQFHLFTVYIPINFALDSSIPIHVVYMTLFRGNKLNNIFCCFFFG